MYFVTVRSIGAAFSVGPWHSGEPANPDHTQAALDGKTAWAGKPTPARRHIDDLQCDLDIAVSKSGSAYHRRGFPGAPIVARRLGGKGPFSLPPDLRVFRRGHHINDETMTNSEVQRRDIPQKIYSSRASEDSFGFYHDMIKASGAAVSRVGDQFDAIVAAHHFGRITLFDRQTIGAYHTRDRVHIKRDGFEHYYIQVLRSGRMISGRSGEERRLIPGDAILFDATQPMESIAENADCVTVILSRDLVDAAAPDACHLHGRILPKGGVGSLSEIILSMIRGASSFSEASVLGSSQLVINEISRIQGRSDASYSDRVGEDNLELSRRLKAELFIENNLAADLSADAVACRIGISRSSLYRAMYAVGGIETVVMRRRAARLRSLILQPGKTASIAGFAERAGFANTSHGSRVFKQIYGQTPGQLRTNFQDDLRSSTKGLHPERMRGWYSTMND